MEKCIKMARTAEITKLPINDILCRNRLQVRQPSISTNNKQQTEKKYNNRNKKNAIQRILREIIVIITIKLNLKKNLIILYI